jgi:hypothetical protein
MSNSYSTLSELISLNDLNARDNGITDLLNKAPVLAKLYATTSSNGTQHKYLKLTGAPTVGFRAVNTGKVFTTSGYTEVTVTLANLDATHIEDIAIAQSYRYGPEAFVEKESISQLQQALFTFESQLWYGTTGGGSGSSTGFSGLMDNTNYSTSSGALTVNAAGTTASTGSSVWFIRSTTDEKSMAAVIGNQGVISIGDTVVTYKPDDTTATSGYPIYMTPISAQLAIQIGGNYSAVRICNLTADSGHGLTDVLLSKALSLFPTDQQPTMVCMSRRSQQQLQASRTTYNPFGAPALWPTDYESIPFVITDSILNTEALV